MADNKDQAIADATAELQKWAAGAPAPKQKQITSTSASAAETKTSSTGPYTEGQLQGDAERQIAASDAFITELQKAITDSSTQARTTAVAIRSAGDATARATVAAGESAASGASAKLAARDLMHAATGDPNGDVVRYVAQRHDALRSMDVLKSEIDAAESTSILDDPLVYLANLVRVPTLKKAYNAVAMKVDNASRVIDTLQSQTAMQQSIDNGVLPTQIRAEAAAKAEAERLNALARASDLQQQTRMQTIQLAQLALQQHGVPLDAHLKVWRALAEKVSVSQAERQGTQITQEQKDIDNKLLLVNMKRVQVGQPEYSPLDFKQLRPEQRDLLIRNGQSSGLANSPGEFYRVLSANGGLNTLDNAMPQIAQFMRDRHTSKYAKAAAEELRNIATGGQKFAQLPIDEQNERILDKAMEKEMAEMRDKDRNDSARDETSAYFFRKTAAATIPELQNNWVSKFIAEEVKKDPSKLANRVEIKDQRLLDELTGRIVASQKAGDTKGIDQLVNEFSDFFRKGQVAQWQFSGAMQLGYPKPEGYAMRYNEHTAATGRGLQVWNPPEIMHSVIMRIRDINNKVNMFQIGSGYVSPKPFVEEPKVN